MPLSKGQSIVGNSEARFRVLIGGRRFGKTFLAIRELAKFARFPNKEILYIAPSYRQAKSIVWKELKQRLSNLKWIKKVNESELCITLVNNSTITLRSAESYDSIRGLGVDFVVFDEFADIAPETWTEAVRPALSDRQGHALFIGTPKGVANWAKDLYDRGQMDYEDWKSWQFTTIDGGNVPESEIAAAKEDLDERTFRQEYMASFETYSGIIYYNFDTDKTFSKLESTIDERTRLHVGMDYNVSPITAAISIVDKKGIWVFDEIEIHGSNTLEMCEEIRNRYPKNPITIYPDASAGHRSTTGTTDLKILKQQGFDVKVGTKNPPVRDRINSVNAAFLNAQGVTRLRISQRCKSLIACLNKQSYKEGTQIPDKESGYDHMNDALGYLIWQLLPIKTPTLERSKPDYFGAY